MTDHGRAGPKPGKPRSLGRLADRIIATIREPTIVLDGDLRVIYANDSFYRTFKVLPPETEGRLIFEIGNRQWDIPRLRILLENILPANQHFDDFEVEHDFLKIGRHTMLLNARRLTQENGSKDLILLAIEDVTERKRLEVEKERLLAEQQVLAEKLSVTNEELQVRAKELIVHQQELERRVKERTLELEQATRELEAFSYAVAHDLKTPLRAIEGFSRILENEHQERLDPEGRRLLKVVTDNTQLMRSLIDSLLNLARLSCQEMRKVSLNLTHMAKGMFQRLQYQEPGRDIRFFVEEAPMAWGDYSLLYQALMNLLENALKFTRDIKIAVIEVGGRSERSENIYYVKDNGVGFNKDDAQKMFVVFQRLHDGKKYEGTGVGLATVQRIIQRHGGRVWAEGKPGAGATFYFSLPKGEE